MAICPRQFFSGSPVEVLVQLVVESFGNIHEADMVREPQLLLI